MPRIVAFVLGCAMVVASAATGWAGDGGRPAGPLPPPAPAHPITIERPWMRPTAGAATGAATAAVYLTIVNQGAAPDQLLRAESPAAGGAGLRAVTMHDDVVRVRTAPVIPIPANGRTVLRPGAWLVVLTGLTRPLDKGDRVPLTLVFKKAGRVETEVAVRNDQPGSFWGLPENETTPQQHWGRAPAPNPHAGGKKGTAKKGIGGLL